MAGVGLVILILYIQIMIIHLSSKTDISALAVIGMMNVLFIYLSILLSYSIFKRLFKKQKVLAFILCCYLSRNIRARNMKYKFKYMILVLSVGLAITLSVLTANEIADLRKSE